MDYTKGEWKVTKHNPLNNWVIDLDTGDLINRITIARCYDNKADAHLIAAAPELYEACKLALHAITVFQEIHGYTEKVKANKPIEEAISKAEGK